MKISTKGIYALEAMIELASRDNNDYTSIREIAQARNFSIKYLEQIFKSLKQANLIISTRGKIGGYKLARNADLITAKDIISSVEISLSPVSCILQKCPREDTCKSKPIWDGIQKEIYMVLESKTLYELTQKIKSEVKL